MSVSQQIDLESPPPPSLHHSRPLRIALLGYRSNPYSGGQGIYIKYLSRALKAIGHHVEVISGPPYPELDDGIRLNKIPSLGLADKLDRSGEFRLRYLKNFTDLFEYTSIISGGFPEPYTFGRRLLSFMRTNLHNYDIIHDNQSLCYALQTLQTHTPTVVTIHHPITSDLKIALQSATGWGHGLMIRRWYAFLSMQKKVVPRLRNILTVPKRSPMVRFVR